MRIAKVGLAENHQPSATRDICRLELILRSVDGAEDAHHIPVDKTFLKSFLELVD